MTKEEQELQDEQDKEHARQTGNDVQNTLDNARDLKHKFDDFSKNQNNQLANASGQNPNIEPKSDVPISSSQPPPSSAGAQGGAVATDAAASTAGSTASTAGSTAASTAASTAGTTATTTAGSAGGSAAAGATVGSVGGPAGMAIGVAIGLSVAASTEAAKKGIDVLTQITANRDSGSSEGLFKFIIGIIAMFLLIFALFTMLVLSFLQSMVADYSAIKASSAENMEEYFEMTAETDIDLLSEAANYYVGVFKNLFKEIYNGSGDDVVARECKEFITDNNLDYDLSMQSYYYMHFYFDNVNYAELLAVFTQDPNFSLLNYNESSFINHLYQEENMRKFYHLKPSIQTWYGGYDKYGNRIEKKYAVFGIERYNLNDIYSLTPTPISFSDKNMNYPEVVNYDPADQFKTNPTEHVSCLGVSEALIRTLLPNVDLGPNVRSNLYARGASPGENAGLYEGDITLGEITDEQILADIAAGYYTKEDFLYMSACMQAEAGRTTEGAVAVGYCLMNRRAKYGSIKGAVSAPGQFASPWSKYLDGSCNSTCKAAAAAVLKGEAPNPIGDCYFFFSASSVWGHKPGVFYVNVGGNMYYKNWGDVTQVVGRSGYVAF